MTVQGDRKPEAQEVAVLFGGVPHQYLEEWGITSDFARVERTLGVRLEVVPMAELAARFDGLDEWQQDDAARLGAELVTEESLDAPGERPDNEAIERAAQLYLAMKLIAAERGADAVTTHCGAIREALGAVPCVALTLFQDEGIPAACQVDIDALLTMMLFKRASGLVSFMGGAFAEDGRLTVNHCVLSRRMAGRDAPLQPYYLGKYHGKFNSPTIHTDLEPGQPVTVARLTCNLESLILTSGTLVATRDLPGRCRNTLVIDVADPARVVAQVKGHQNHFVVALGDHRRAMADLAAEAGIGAVAV